MQELCQKMKKPSTGGIWVGKTFYSGTLADRKSRRKLDIESDSNENED